MLRVPIVPQKPSMEKCRRDRKTGSRMLAEPRAVHFPIHPPKKEDLPVQRAMTTLSPNGPAPSLSRISLAVVFSGLAALLLDEAAAKLTLGYWVPISWRFVGIYAVSGAVVSLVMFALLRFLRREAGALQQLGWAVAGIYTAALAERAHHVLRPGLGEFGAIWLLIPMALVVVGAVWALGWIFGREHGVGAGFGVAMAAAAGLAINRNVVASPLEPRALALDAGAVMAVLALACACRFLGRAKGIAAWVLLLGAGIGIWSIADSADGKAVDGRVVSDGLASDGVVSGDPEDHGRAPDLLLVMIDTLRQDVFQSVVAETPEGLAFRETLDGAVWFSNGIAAAPWTAPSMGSIMTGLYPREHGLIKPAARRDLAVFTRLPDEIPTLAEKLGRRGYQTSAIVANPILHPQSGLSRGFDRYEVLAGPTVKLPLLTALTRFGVLDREFYQQARWVKHRLRHELEQVDPEHPLFLWLHLMDPHDPLYEHELSEHPGEAGLPDVDRLYRREVRYTLAQLTEMLKMLKDHGLWQRSALVLASDHGEMFPSDGRGLPGRPPLRKVQGHGHALYDELAKIPLVIRPPGGLSEPRQVDVLTHHTDLHDTIADLLGSDLRRIGRDRVSLMPWLGPQAPSEPPQTRQLALIEATHSGPEQRALRTLEWKLIERPMGQTPPELYELAVDPLEERNSAPSRPGQTTTLSQRLKKFWYGLDDPPVTSTPELDDETRRQLEALGYL